MDLLGTMNPNVRLHFHHPIREFLYVGLSDDERKKVTQMFEERHRQRVAKLEAKLEAKQQMDRAFRKASTARKIYRTSPSDETRNALQLAEEIHRNLYNIYWYEHVFVR